MGSALFFNPDGSVAVLLPAPVKPRKSKARPRRWTTVDAADLPVMGVSKGAVYNRVARWKARQ